MASKQRRWLIESIEALLVPELERSGFARVPLTEEEARSEIRIGFPFGRLRRLGQGGFELVEIQLDKRGAPAFRLNLGVAPPDGTEHPVAGRISQDDVWALYLDQSFIMYDLVWTCTWFKVRHLPWSPVTKDDYLSLARKVVDRIPEIEALFRSGERGRHLREVRLG